MANKPLSPGSKAPDSGQYKPVGPRGGAVPGSGEITGVKDHRLPPTPEPGQKWQIVDPTKHKK